MNFRDSRNNELKASDVCTYKGDSFDPFNEVPDDYEGDPCTVKSLGPSQIVARIVFEGDPDTYKVNTSALLFHHRPSAKQQKERKTEEDENQDA